METNTHKALCELLKGDYRHETPIQLVKRVEGLLTALRKERDEALARSDVAQLLERCKRASKKHEKFPHDEKDVEGLTLDDIPKLVAYSFQARNEIVDLRKPSPDATQRYVLHGDIKPCTVLYSDDTTTLLRLETQDMMCETETIEWSDELTYKCQELLRGTGLVLDSVMLKYSNRVAQLVRDGSLQFGDDLGADEAFP